MNAAPDRPCQAIAARAKKGEMDEPDEPDEIDKGNNEADIRISRQQKHLDDLIDDTHGYQDRHHDQEPYKQLSAAASIFEPVPQQERVAPVVFPDIGPRPEPIDAEGDDCQQHIFDDDPGQRLAFTTKFDRIGAAGALQIAGLTVDQDATCASIHGVRHEITTSLQVFWHSHLVSSNRKMAIRPQDTRPWIGETWHLGL